MGKDNEERTDRVDDHVTSGGASDRPAMPCIVHTSDTLTDTVYWLSADKELKIGRAPENDVFIRDQSVSQHHARVVLTPAGAVSIEDLGSTNGTYVNGEKVVRHALWDGDKVHIGPHHALKFCYQVNDAPAAAVSGEADATRDALTGVYARQYLLMRIDRDFIKAKMRHQDLALLMFDVDGFEEIKETHGAAAGDMVLREVAKVVSSVLRREDIFARYENHTFAVRLRNLTEAEVVVLAQRIGRVVKYHPFLHEGKNIRVTVSLGNCLQKEIIWNEQAITTRTKGCAPVSAPDSVNIFILDS
ncbi:MAG: GGDEF domain-containing protein [Gammaproteobacteria bacterium]|nr:GGDEF domain-containing protein [Gammaproteobacteria bacterium]